MNLRIPSLLFAFVLLAIGTIAVACGGGGDGDGGPLTLDQYYERLEEHAVEFEQRGQAVEQEYDFTAAGSEEEAIDLARGLFREGLTVLEDFVDSLDGMAPPADVADVHASAVNAGRELIDVFESALTVMEATDSIDEIAAILGAPGFTDASDAFTDGCFELQDIADANDISADLLCGD